MGTLVYAGFLAAFVAVPIVALILVRRARRKGPEHTSHRPHGHHRPGR